MGDTAGMFAALTGAQAVAGAASRFTAAGALDASSDFNRRMAAIQAGDAITRGDMAANSVSAQARQQAGYARAAAGASGIDSSTGSAADTQAGIVRTGAIDAATVRTNAMREAWGLTTQATIDSAASDSRAAGLRTEAVTTLLTGAGKSYGIATGKIDENGNRINRSPTGAVKPPRVRGSP